MKIMRKTSIFLSSLLVVASAYAQKSEDGGKVRNLDEVVVSASRTQAKLSELPNKVEVITKDDIELSAVDNLGELLKENTAVDVIQYPNFLSGIGMRGFAPSTETKYVTLLVDGIPAGTANISTLMLNGVQQVEVLKGPFSSLYGSSAMGGLVNVVPMKNKGKLTGNASFTYGSSKTMKGAVALGGKIYKGLSFDLNAYYNEQKEDYEIGTGNFFALGETEKLILWSNKTNGAKMNHSSYKNYGGGLRLGYNFNSNWSLNLYGSMFMIDDVVTNGNFWGTYENKKKDLLRYNTRLVLEGRAGKHHLRLVPHYSYYSYANKTVEKDIKTYEASTMTAGVQLQDIITFGKHKLTVGFDNLNTYTEGHSFDAAKNGEEKAPYKPNFHNNSIGAFAQANFKLMDDKLNLSAGLRYDLINLTLQANEFLKNEEKAELYSRLSPNLGLKYELLKNTFLHASYGQAFMAPDAYQKAGMYTTVGKYGVTTKGNPDLKGESSSTIDVGLSYSNRDCGLEFDATYFHTDHTNFIVKESLTDKDGKPYKSFRNAQEAVIDGLEVMASYDLGHIWDYKHSVKFFFNGTYLLTSRVFAPNKAGEEVWQDMMYVSDKQLNFGIDVAPIKALRFKFSGRYMGSRIEQNWYIPSKWTPDVRPGLLDIAAKTQPEYVKEGQLKHPAFMVFDAAISYNIYKGLALTLNANNIFDENYTYKDGYNMPGRTLMAKLSYSF